MVDSRRVQDVRLVSACPGDACLKSIYHDWVHSNCGAELRMDWECDVWCAKHKEKDFIQNWRFKCHQKTHGGNIYVGWDLDALAVALSFIAKSFGTLNQKKAIIELNNKIYERWKD